MVASQRRLASAWLVAGGVTSLALTALVFANAGYGEPGTRAALRATARLSFSLFLALFAAPTAGGGPLGRGEAWLAGHKYEIFSAFAAAHFVHLGLILRLYRLSPANPFDPGAVIVGGLAYALIFIMLVSLAFEIAPARIGQRILEPLTLYYVWLVFVLTFAGALDTQGWPVLVALLFAIAILPARWLGLRSAQRSRAVPR